RVTSQPHGLAGFPADSTAHTPRPHQGAFLMAYPHDQLTDDEQLLVQQHPHWKVLLLPMIGGLVLVTGCCYLAALTASTSWHEIAWIVLAVLGSIPLFGLMLAQWLRWTNAHVMISSENIMFRERIRRRPRINIPLLRIASIRYEHDLNDLLIGFGTLIFEAMSDDPQVFTDIPAVVQVHNLLYQ